MEPTTKKLLEEILELSKEDRLKVLEGLLESLDVEHALPQADRFASGETSVLDGKKLEDDLG